MIILDTNVVSALMEINPDRAIVPWLDSMHPDDFMISAITVYEIELGIRLAKSDRRKRELSHAFQRFLWEIVFDRILAFDEHAAIKAAQLTFEQRKIGRIIDIRDTQIAAIALSHDLPLATRNVKHFEASGVEIINPWEQQ